jgi:hypothetical protein
VCTHQNTRHKWVHVHVPRNIIKDDFIKNYTVFNGHTYTVATQQWVGGACAAVRRDEKVKM